MILLNFSHPITDRQREQIRCTTGLDVTGEDLTVVRVPCQLDINKDFASQVVELADSCPLSAKDWQTRSILVNLPALSTAAALLAAELHGRCGYYPAASRFRQIEGVIPPQYELAELLDINGQRQNARKRRQ